MHENEARQELSDWIASQLGKRGDVSNLLEDVLLEAVICAMDTPALRQALAPGESTAALARLVAGVACDAATRYFAAVAEALDGNTLFALVEAQLGPPDLDRVRAWMRERDDLVLTSLFP